MEHTPRFCEPPTRAVRSLLLASAGVRHGFSTRLGGVSRAYLKQDEQQNEQAADRSRSGELNLGFTASDSRENVLRNRATLLRDVFGEPSGPELPLVTLHQVHSTAIHRVARENAGPFAVLSGDGLLTCETELVLGIQTADCVPVLLADRHTGAVAVFHAGWRGTLGRIVEQGVARMRSEFGTEPENLLAAIGPAIGPCCYEVGEEIGQQFRETFQYAEELLHQCSTLRTDCEPEEPSRLQADSASAGSKRLLDLPETNRRQLLDAGLSDTAIDLLPWCTRCRKDLFFSYRAERGLTGRMLSVIART